MWLTAGPALPICMHVLVAPHVEAARLLDEAPDEGERRVAGTGARKPGTLTTPRVATWRSLLGRIPRRRRATPASRIAPGDRERRGVDDPARWPRPLARARSTRRPARASGMGAGARRGSGRA